MTKVRSLRKKDRKGLKGLLAEVRGFTDEEIKIALELVDSYLAGKPDYLVKVASDEKEGLLGYICYGRTPLTDGVWDIYWLVVGGSYRRQGVAGVLLQIVEEELKVNGARTIIVETSSREDYEPARRFYEKSGFKKVCRIKDFYSAGNDKIVYEKRL